MFSKQSEKLESFVGSSSIFRGDIRSKGTLRIDGTVEGNVEADWLIIGEKAHLKGDVTARGVIVGGRIEGNVFSKELLEIKSKGYITGDIRTAKLVVSEGGLLEGRSSMHRGDSKIVEFHTKDKAAQ